MKCQNIIDEVNWKLVKKKLKSIDNVVEVM